MKIKNIVKYSLIILFVLSLASNFVFSANDWEKAAQELAEDSPIKTPEKIFDILAGVLKYVYTIFFIVAIIFILVAAFNFLTAKDQPEKIKGARSQIFWAVIAIAIALLSVGAAQIINSFIKNP